MSRARRLLREQLVEHHKALALGGGFRYYGHRQAFRRTRLQFSFAARLEKGGTMATSSPVPCEICKRPYKEGYWGCPKCRNHVCHDCV